MSDIVEFIGRNDPKWPKCPDCETPLEIRALGTYCRRCLKWVSWTKAKR